jgi:homoserine/homoserine lactone efflux protein
MSFHLYLAFVSTCVLLALTPGPNMVLFLTNGMAHGTRAALLTICGGTVGLIFLVAMTMLGMGAIMAFTAEYFNVIRWIGALYLIWLGIDRLYGAFALREAIITPLQEKRWFWQGLSVSLSNPKVLLFLGAFFPQFIEARKPIGPQLALMGVSIVVILASVDCSVALAVGSARRWITGQGRRLSSGIGGALLICGGLWLALIRRE